MENKVDYFASYPEGYEQAKALLDFLPEEARDGFMGGFMGIMLGM